MNNHNEEESALFDQWSATEQTGGGGRGTSELGFHS